MGLTQIAFLLFCAIAAGGLLMAGMIAARKSPPSLLGPVHGLGAAAALAVLLAANLQGGETTPDRAWWAFGVFVAGLLGGLMFFRILFRNNAPLVLIGGHASLALIGLWLLYPVAFPG